MWTKKSWCFPKPKRKKGSKHPPRWILKSHPEILWIPPLEPSLNKKSMVPWKITFCCWLYPVNKNHESHEIAFWNPIECHKKSHQNAIKSHNNSSECHKIILESLKTNKSQFLVCLNHDFGSQNCSRPPVRLVSTIAWGNLRSAWAPVKAWTH